MTQQFGERIDCNRTHFPDEKAICRSPRLLVLDRKAAEVESHHVSPSDDVIQAHDAWLGLRRSCRDSPNCLSDRYVQRLEFLERQSAPVANISESHAGPATSEPPPTPTFPDASKRISSPESLFPNQSEETGALPVPGTTDRSHGAANQNASSTPASAAKISIKDHVFEVEQSLRDGLLSKSFDPQGPVLVLGILLIGLGLLLLKRKRILKRRTTKTQHSVVDLLKKSRKKAISKRVKVCACLLLLGGLGFGISRFFHEESIPQFLYSFTQISSAPNNLLSTIATFLENGFAVAILLFAFYVACKLIYAVVGWMSKCPRCGRSHATQAIDEHVISSRTKFRQVQRVDTHSSYEPGRQPTYTYRVETEPYSVQTIERHLQCRFCGYAYRTQVEREG